MANAWSNVDSNFPMLDTGEDIREQYRKLHNYMFALTEELKYTLDNLDMTNINSSALDGYTGEITEQIFKAEQKTEEVRGLVEELQSGQATQHSSITQLNSAIEDLAYSVGRLTAMVQAGESEISIGGEGMVVNLTGTVKVNGVVI